jgi:hypothetical protein
LADRERLPDWLAVFFAAALGDVLVVVLVPVPVRAAALLLEAALGGA